MTDVFDLIRERQPALETMPFCTALLENKFDRQKILCAEIVELYRALNTRQKIQDMYKSKLQSGSTKNQITTNDVSRMEEIIDDEGETDEHIDHLDMRFKLFAGTPVSRQSSIRYNEDLESINNEWVAVCEESSLFSLMAVTAAIEEWYAPVSRFFEDEYRKRGFTEEELELFICHQEADVDHSEVQFVILSNNSDKIDLDEVDKMLVRTFKTSVGYDKMKLRFALSDQPLESYIE